MFFAKLYQMRSYVIALENAAEYDATFVGVDNDGLYFRNYDNLLLVGGGDHRTGTEGGGYDALRRFAKNNYPYASEKYAWAAQDCMSLDGVPYVGRYGSLLPDVFTATGFNEWGMTTSMLSAKMLTCNVQGKNNKYEKLFYPSRSMLSGQLVINVGETIINFLTPKTKRCPHMGCALKWNKAEHSWDCPCHGSRFSEQGKLIDNPAKKGLK